MDLSYLKSFKDALLTCKKTLIPTLSWMLNKNAPFILNALNLVPHTNTDANLCAKCIPMLCGSNIPQMKHFPLHISVKLNLDRCSSRQSTSKSNQFARCRCRCRLTRTMHLSIGRQNLWIVRETCECSVVRLQFPPLKHSSPWDIFQEWRWIDYLLTYLDRL